MFRLYIITSNFLIQQNISRGRPLSPTNKAKTTMKSSDASLKFETSNTNVSSPSVSPSQQTSLRVFRNINSKQQQPTEQLLRNNNSIQRSETRCSPSPSPPESSSPSHLEESDSRINNSPLDFTSKKVSLRYDEQFFIEIELIIGCFEDINIYFICLILQTLPMTKNSNVDKEIDSDEHNDKLQHNNTYNGDRNSPNRGMNEIQYLYILNSY